MLDSVRLKTKMILILICASASVLLLLAASALQQRTTLIEGRKAAIRTVTESAYNILDHYQAQEASGMPRDLAQKAALAEIARIRYGGDNHKTEYIYVYQMDGINLHHVRKELIGTNVAATLRDARGHYPVQDLINALQGAQSAFVDSMFPRKAGEAPVPKLQYVMRFGSWNWFLGTGAWLDDIALQYRNELLMGAGLFLLVLGIMGALIWVIARGILNQIGGEPRSAIEVMTRAANGDLTIHIGSVAPNSMLASFSLAQGSIRAMVGEIRKGAGRVRTGAAQIVEASRDVAQAAQTQVDATSAMAAAVQELTVSINHISDASSQTQASANEAAQLAQQGESLVFLAREGINTLSETVENAASRIGVLEQKANQIGTITAVIKDIAGQTNLLALNAAIEAARAGEQGRGFAVVADEVRKLAERTANATIEIQGMIDTIQQEIRMVTGVMQSALPQAAEGSRLTGDAADTLRTIRNGTHLALSRINEVASATSEQSLASTSIAQRVEEIASMVEQTHVRMQEAVNIAQTLSSVSDELDQQIGRFRIERTLSEMNC
ncbi:MAG: mcp [Proteobacteria bacterium]|nr:mcp [Pseudomonadota bacterium]